MARTAAKTTRPSRRQRKAGAEDATPLLLLRAAAAEFAERGFGNTDTNRIARRAGFAPQTFYRWYKDKIDIFIQVYQAWISEELKVIAALEAAEAPAERLVDVCVTHHRAYRGFRRNLRQLSLENAKVRAARAESRLRQVNSVRILHPDSLLTPDDIAVALLEIERLADAIVEGEFADMKLGDAAARSKLAAIIRSLRAT